MYYIYIKIYSCVRACVERQRRFSCVKRRSDCADKRRRRAAAILTRASATDGNIDEVTRRRARRFSAHVARYVYMHNNSCL